MEVFASNLRHPKITTRTLFDRCTYQIQPVLKRQRGIKSCPKIKASSDFHQLWTITKIHSSHQHGWHTEPGRASCQKVSEAAPWWPTYLIFYGRSANITCDVGLLLRYTVFVNSGVSWSLNFHEYSRCLDTWEFFFVVFTVTQELALRYVSLLDCFIAEIIGIWVFRELFIVPYWLFKFFFKPVITFLCFKSFFVLLYHCSHVSVNW